MDLPAPQSDLSDEAVVSAIQRADATLVATVMRRDDVEFHDDPDATWYLSGIREPLFNGVCRTEMSDRDAGRRIDGILGRFRHAGVPAMWWTGPRSSPGDLEARLEAEGLQGEHLPGMALRLEELPEGPVPEGLRIETVVDDAGVEHWIQAGGDAFGIEPALRPLYRRTPEAVLSGQIPGWLCTGWVDGRAVATSMVSVATGAAQVSNVATLPAYRGRGIGAAITAHPLRLARERGYELAVLSATPSGAPLYERLGFRTRCRIGVFTLAQGG